MSRTPFTKAPADQKVSWFELFYDLLFVAAVSQVGKVLVKDASWPTALLTFSAVAALFFVWLLTTLSHGFVRGDIAARRLLVLVQMLALLVGALALSKDGLSGQAGFLALGVVFATIGVIYSLHRRWDASSDLPNGLVAGAAAASAVLLVAGGLLLPVIPAGAITGLAPLLLLASSAIVAWPVLGRLLRGESAHDGLDRHHLEERLGLLVIIVLGEQFVSLVASLSALGDIPNVYAFVLSLLVAFSLWVLYFSGTLVRTIPVGAVRQRAWILVHVCLVYGLVSVAAKFSALTLTPLDQESGGSGSAWTTLPTLVVMASLAALTWVSGTGRIYLRVHLLAVAALAVLYVFDMTQGDTMPWFTSTGALVVIADALACSVIRRSRR